MLVYEKDLLKEENIFNISYYNQTTLFLKYNNNILNNAVICWNTVDNFSLILRDLEQITGNSELNKNSKK